MTSMVIFVCSNIFAFFFVYNIGKKHQCKLAVPGDITALSLHAKRSCWFSGNRVVKLIGLYEYVKLDLQLLN